MSWQCIVEVTGILGTLGVGGVIIWLFNRPKVRFISKPICSWHFTYRDGKSGREVSETRVMVDVKLQNDGKDDTNVEVQLKTPISFYSADKVIAIKGGGARIEATVFIYIPSEDGHLNKGQSMSGTLKLKPWGQRRLWIGKKEPTAKVIISENQADIYNSLHNRAG